MSVFIAGDELVAGDANIPFAGDELIVCHFRCPFRWTVRIVGEQESFRENVGEERRRKSGDGAVGEESAGASDNRERERESGIRNFDTNRKPNYQNHDEYRPRNRASPEVNKADHRKQGRETEHHMWFRPCDLFFVVLTFAQLISHLSYKSSSTPFDFLHTFIIIPLLNFLFLQTLIGFFLSLPPKISISSSLFTSDFSNNLILFSSSPFSFCRSVKIIDGWCCCSSSSRLSKGSS
ncbi:hypothetical protein L6452_18700 [Arctium lappa]|uniref:Uncharacterized protein n=1 Tax=Arctium lappa TaxID=4217 RepID=A0ACB9C6W9_ARCLA|nr:hypothetical protein L6452_18700 [Arctium lappa]